MKIGKYKRPETTESPPADEIAAQAPQETATVGAAERANVRGFPRAAPRSQALLVIRSWPGVQRGQIIHVNPAAERRLILGGFVEVAA